MNFNENFAKRFVSDYKLPIGIFEESYFNFYLKRYEYNYQALPKYEKVCDFIDTNYDGDAELFLKDYYDIRDKIIVTVTEKEAYKNFISMPFEKYSIPSSEKIDNVSKSVYNEENNGYTFISFDLKSANFQALRYVNPEIVNNAETYTEFIKGFTRGTKFENFPYIEESKYTRQVIFGKMNASRQITIENYLIHKVWGKLKDKMGNSLVAHTSDELIFKIESVEGAQMFADCFIHDMEKEGIMLHYEIFNLECYHLNNGRKNILDFCIKNIFPDYSIKFVKVPLTLRHIVESLYDSNNASNMEIDRLFATDNGTKAIYVDNFKIIKNEKKIEENGQ